MHDQKKQLNITLTEPVAFLRTSDPSGRLHSDPNDSPTLVRGILTLDVAKPIGISSIEVELTGVLAISYPEAIGSRRIELPEKQKVHSSTITVFRADQVPRARNCTSIGPGLLASRSVQDEHPATSSFRPPSLPRGRSERRCIASVPSNLGPTPPYTAAPSPTSIQPSLTVPEEHPAQILEELRQALRDNLEGQGYDSGSISPSSHSRVAFSLPDPMIHPNASSTSNDFSQRGSDNYPNDFVHTCLPLEGDTSSQNTSEELSHVPPRDDTSVSRPLRAHSPENTHGIRPHTRGRSHDASNTPGGHSRLRLSLSSVLDAVREITSRASSRSPSVAALEERERGRTRVRTVVEEQLRDTIGEVDEAVVGPGNGSQPGPNAAHMNNHTEHREHHLLGLGRVFGLERDHEKEKDSSKEPGECWREFKPGTYSYPISFLLPPHLPPTFSLPSASLSYALKAVAHRPGAFTSKLTCQVPLLLVAAPAIGTGEGIVAGDPGPLSIQQQWQGKLVYSFGLSSRLFLLGSERRLEAAANDSARANTESPVEGGVEARIEAVYGSATLDLTILPVEKVKIWRLDIIVDQRVKYIGERGQSFRDDDRRQVRLLEVQDTCSAEELGLVDEEEQTHKNKHKHKHEESTRIPLLPTPISPHRSPLLRYVPPSTDPSTLAGPGPYTLAITFGLPGCSSLSDGESGLHFTVKQKSSCVKVEHALRLVFRVECVGDEDTYDHEEDEKKRLFDIAVQTPITILSCRCVPEYQMLPRYSRFTEDSFPDHASCACQEHTVGPSEQGLVHQFGNHLRHDMISSSTSSFGNDNRAADEPPNGHGRSRSPSRVRRNAHTNLLNVSLHSHSPSPSPIAWEGGWNRSPSHAPTQSHARHHHSRSQSYSVSTSHVRGHSQTPSVTPHHSRPPSPLARYERLVSGLESEAGEAPPSYESVALGS